jgi:hypothetical protein
LGQPAPPQVRIDASRTALNRVLTACVSNAKRKAAFRSRAGSYVESTVYRQKTKTPFSFCVFVALARKSRSESWGRIHSARGFSPARPAGATG